jgi:hypothetical protein
MKRASWIFFSIALQSQTQFIDQKREIATKARDFGLQIKRSPISGRRLQMCEWGHFKAN